MDLSQLPPKQKRVYDYIRDRIERSGGSPTIEEIRRDLSLRSVATVHEHLTTLENRGLIERTRHSPRSIALTKHLDEANAGREIPLLGVVAAGQPIVAVLTHERVWVPSAMCGRHTNAFALRVEGDSMAEDHILDGDIIVLEQRQVAESGETVVALIDNTEATVKKFYRADQHIHLKPANAAYKPLILASERVQVQGVVKGILHYA